MLGPTCSPPRVELCCDNVSNERGAQKHSLCVAFLLVSLASWTVENSSKQLHQKLAVVRNLVPDRLCSALVRLVSAEGSVRCRTCSQTVEAKRRWFSPFSPWRMLSAAWARPCLMMCPGKHWRWEMGWWKDGDGEVLVGVTVGSASTGFWIQPFFVTSHRSDGLQRSPSCSTIMPNSRNH